MPFVTDPWMGEGFVTYYTELVRTRRGHRSEADGWQELWQGFRRGMRHRDTMTLREFSESMGRTHAYQRVYWGGAAIAFLLDVRMRIESDGKRSLDDAMREIRRCCGDAREKVESDELLAKLDRWYGKPIFTETASAALRSEGFPDVEAALEKLGVRVVDGHVALDDEHPAAKHRRAIMAPR
jgi:predicted metalloprotease with PDZ domain